jgi:uncharacterized protein YecE (DUF72 family)
MEFKWQAIEKAPDLTKKGFFVGSVGFNFTDWVGRFYPPGYLPENFLEFYQTYFQFVEIDSVNQTKMRVFYQELAKKSKSEMCYGIRIPKSISCPKSICLESGKRQMKAFLTELSPLVECDRVFSLLFQVDIEWTRTQERLDYLSSVASLAQLQRIDTHFEFRSRSWHNFLVLEQMRNRGIGICNTEVPSHSAFPCRPYRTTEKGYVRYLGLNYAKWKKLGWVKSYKDREKQKEELYDYLYNQSQIEEKMKDQIKLSRKVSKMAVVFCNCPRAQSVVNSIQNLHQLQSHFEIQTITR